MIHQDLYVISAITSEYMFTHMSLDSIVLINI
jgi:hypothetical protein